MCVHIRSSKDLQNKHYFQVKNILFETKKNHALKE